MFETAMQERHADNTVKAADLPRDQPECGVESIARRPIDSLDYPQRGDEPDKGGDPPQEYAHVTLAHHVSDNTCRQKMIKVAPRRSTATCPRTDHAAPSSSVARLVCRAAPQHHDGQQLSADSFCDRRPQVPRIVPHPGSSSTRLSDAGKARIADLA